MALTLGAALVLLGCPTKKVTITSHPDGATIIAAPIVGGVEGRQWTLGTTPLSASLDFTKAERYRIVARKPHFNDAEAAVTYEPKTPAEYHLELHRITVIVPLIVFEPTITDTALKLAPVRHNTIGYLDVVERSPNVKGVTRITANEDRGAILGRPVHSPVDDVLVYEWIQTGKAKPVNYTMQDGDTLETVAAAFGVSTDELLKANPQLEPKKVAVGTRINVVQNRVFSNIWTQKIGSYAKTRVTYGKWRDLFPAFTPDGQYLVFSSNRSGPNATLWRVKVAGGGGITKITNTLAEDYRSSVSPDGRLIAYDSSPPGAERIQLWTIQSNGALPSQLRDGAAPRISPDGSRILFVRTDKETGRSQIWLTDAEGTTETQLTQNQTYDVLGPQWSPDGTWIAFASNESPDDRGRPNFDIWMMTADGSDTTQLTTNGSHDDGPCWDPTGRWIYFRSNRGGAWNIWRLIPAQQREQ